ncbi:hypothetical protein [Pseudomonas sp. D(2018)]|uniref:hypothetical protein n=1 Tax=Pseudomonas sp. D(2018) TaxID=2502238 RepID=UPI0010F8710E|nr:hypothetical protein [Pseudomonas sp. D(2018)]
MPNWFHINTPSNLIVGVIASRYTPTDSKVDKFIPAPAKALDKFYKWLAKHPGLMPDVGEIMTLSPSVYDSIVNGKSGDARPQRSNYRAVQTEPPVEDRASLIAAWIKLNPAKDAYDLNDKFGCGMTAARAYIAKYV